MITITDVPSRSRYEATVDGEVVGFVTYRERDDELLLTHAEIDPTRRGQGLGEQVVRATLEEVSATHTRVIPVCGFVRSVMLREPEYRSLMAG